jgi:hypothetical protein
MKIQTTMDTFTFFIIFIIILFLYVHIIAQYKKSEDLEIYEMDYTTNQSLQEICNIKQPVLFQLNISDSPLLSIDNLSYKNDVRVYSQPMAACDRNDKASDYILLPFPQYYNLIATAVKPHYYTQNNRDFIDEADLYDTFRELDAYLKPYYTAQTIYDVWTGGRFVTTPLRYHINYRQYLYVTTGKIHVKMTPYKSRKYLHPIDDYENFDFRSPVNPFTPQPEYMHDMDKIKFLEFDVHAGYVLCLPPYWWYSIQYAADSADKKDTVIMSVIYNSFMNILAYSPVIARYYMQLQNTKNIITRSFTGSQGRNEDSHIEESLPTSNDHDDKPANNHPEKASDEIIDSIRMIQKKVEEG